MDDETQRLRELDYYRMRLEVSEAQLREAQRKLAATQERYTTLYNLTPAGHMSIDERGAISQANDSAFEILGVTRNILRGRTLLNFVAEDDHQIYERFENALLGDDAVHICEVRIVRSDGDRIIAELRGRRVAGATENAPFGFIVITDVTAARNMHDELKRRNRELAALNQFARSVSESLQFEDVVANLKDMLLETSNITTGAIFSYDAGQNELHLEAIGGMFPSSTTLQPSRSAGTATRQKAPGVWSRSSPDRPHFMLATFAKFPRSKKGCRKEARSTLEPVTIS